MNARFPIDNPAPQPKQPFSRQNYVGAIGGPLKQGKVWLFSSFEYVHENASINYSPDSLTQFNALSQLAADGLIPGVSNIPVPQYVRVPFNDYLGTIRFDWSQSARSQWFIRGGVDSYLTNNNLIQQATLQSTGVTTHANYFNVVVNNTFAFTPTWLGSFTFTASTLNNTQARNSNLGFALAFPFSATTSTISGFETFGDQQFITGITAFPVLRKQDKYQFRYDVSHSTGRHAPRFGIDFIHEPVLSGALSGTEENLTIFPHGSDRLPGESGCSSPKISCAVSSRRPGSTCTNTPAGNGSFSQNVQRLGFYANDSWRVTPTLTVNYGLRYDTTFGLFQASGRDQFANAAYSTLKALQVPLVNGIPHDYRKAFAPRLGIAWSPGNENLVHTRRCRTVLERSGAERMGRRIAGRELAAGALPAAGRSGLHSRHGGRRRRCAHRSELPHARTLCTQARECNTLSARTGRRAQTTFARPACTPIADTRSRPATACSRRFIRRMWRASRPMCR